MTQVTHHHTRAGVYDHTWTSTVFPDGIEVKVEWHPPVSLTWDQVNDPEILACRFGFMHVTGFVTMVQKLAELFTARNAQ